MRIVLRDVWYWTRGICDSGTSSSSLRVDMPGRYGSTRARSWVSMLAGFLSLVRPVIHLDHGASCFVFQDWTCFGKKHHRLGQGLIVMHHDVSWDVCWNEDLYKQFSKTSIDLLHGKAVFGWRVKGKLHASRFGHAKGGPASACKHALQKWHQMGIRAQGEMRQRGWRAARCLHVLQGNVCEMDVHDCDSV